MARLLVMSHSFQAVVGLGLIALVWPGDLPPWRQWVMPMVGTSVFYLGGQVGLFLALKRTTASRVSPLLGLKLVVLAGLAVVLLGDSLAGMQWLAVGLAVAAAFTLNYTGGATPGAAVLAVLLACSGYAGSDLCIRLMIEGMAPVHPLHAAVFGLGLTYLLCGLLVAPLLPWYGARTARAWGAVMPYSWTWLLSMALLFTCFAAAGVVLGNILQTSRGLISILIAPAVAGAGLVHLETHVPASVFWRRVGAAAMMCAAIALYLLA